MTLNNSHTELNSAIKFFFCFSTEPDKYKDAISSG